MLDYLIQQIIHLQGYIIFCVVSGIVLLLGWILLCIGVSFKSRRMAILGLLFGLSTRGKMYVCASWLRVMFVMWCIVFRVTLEPIHYTILFMLFIWAAILLLKILDIIGSIVAGMITGVALTVGNLLLEYNEQIRYEMTVEVVYWMLGAFIILYSVYLFIGELSKISSKRGANDVQIEE